MDNCIAVNSLSFSFNHSMILDGISFTVPRGSFTGVIGPNGAGKSTLIKCLSHTLTTQSGTIQINKKNIKEYSRTELARMIGVVPSELASPFDFTVYDMVAMGRTPYTGFLSLLTRQDRTVISDILNATDTVHLQERALSTLSSGEYQRVLIAQALAQEPEILMLDEPTSHLDINHRKEILDLLWKLHVTKQLTIILVSHDINTAADYCTDILILKNGSVLCYGKPEQVLTASIIHDCYGIKTHVSKNPVSGKPVVFVVPGYRNDQ
ncbi:MAG: ATP-binding cassette domain-containing protein [Elusimicrobia bacterium]|nr:ATP-binding cassette domain-containing protein [Elusimicrobiota bacterium]MBD3411763.1 ATP-binding cassette domain-containing protein [Elusimicrobiota bacterium]